MYAGIPDSNVRLTWQSCSHSCSRLSIGSYLCPSTYTNAFAIVCYTDTPNGRALPSRSPARVLYLDEPMTRAEADGALSNKQGRRPRHHPQIAPLLMQPNIDLDDKLCIRPQLAHVACRLWKQAAQGLWHSEPNHNHCTRGISELSDFQSHSCRRRNVLAEPYPWRCTWYMVSPKVPNAITRAVTLVNQ